LYFRGKAIKARAGLFLGRGFCQTFLAGEASGEIRVGLDERDLLFDRGATDGIGEFLEEIVASQKGTMLPGLVSDPGGMLEEGAEDLDKFRLAHGIDLLQGDGSRVHPYFLSHRVPTPWHGTEGQEARVFVSGRGWPAISGAPRRKADATEIWDEL
jgi:hypothetical protein